jgi:hypothetical protein
MQTVWHDKSKKHTLKLPDVNTQRNGHSTEYLPRIAPDITKLFLRMPHAATPNGVSIETSHLVGGITKPSANIHM